MAVKFIEFRPMQHVWFQTRFRSGFGTAGFTFCSIKKEKLIRALILPPVSAAVSPELVLVAGCRAVRSNEPHDEGWDHQEPPGESQTFQRNLPTRM